MLQLHCVNPIYLQSNHQLASPTSDKYIRQDFPGTTFAADMELFHQRWKSAFLAVCKEIRLTNANTVPAYDLQQRGGHTITQESD
jgi:hypothetical protein